MLGFQTGDARVDSRLEAFVEALRTLYAERLRAVYLTGSWREGTAVAGCDLDVVVVFHERANLEEARALSELTRTFNEEVPRLSSWGKDSDDPCAPLPLHLRHAALLWGEDAFDARPDMSANQTRRGMVISALMGWRMLRTGREHADAPEQPEWSGYDLGSSQSPRLKLLVSTVARVAGARTASRGVVMPSESACCLRYHEVVSDEDTDTVEQVYQTLKLEWEYAWPASPAGEERLRALCEEVVGLERRFHEEVASWSQDARVSGDEDAVEWANLCARFMPPDAQATRWWVTEDDVVSLWHDRASWRWWIMVNVRIEPVRMVVRERGGFDVLVDLDGETRYCVNITS